MSPVVPIVNLGNPKISSNVSPPKVNVKSIHFVMEPVESVPLSRRPPTAVNVNLRVENVHRAFVPAEICSAVQWERGSGSINRAHRCQTRVN